MKLPKPENHREELCADLEELFCQLLEAEPMDDLTDLLPIGKKGFSAKRLRKLRRRLRANMNMSPCHPNKQKTEKAVTSWVLRLLTGKESLSALRETVGDVPDLSILYQSVRNGKCQTRNKALVVLAHLRGLPSRLIGRVLRLSRTSVSRYCLQYTQGGVDDLFRGSRCARVKRDSDSIKSAVFSVLHSPPRTYDINRTSWKYEDLIRVLKDQGIELCRDTIRAIIDDAGYNWRKARTVLTSNDPEYRSKLERITAILSKLGPNERFFSIDEFGPFAVKMIGGEVLTPPGELPTVPQHQKSKGSLIVTGALELATNQVTHFYSDNKNTAEIIKLLDVLLVQYADCERIYLSWDAASWHDSHELHERVEAINGPEYRATHRGPYVELAPLPSCAQFLNVIESVFSGMARAIIHSSDYQSVEEAKAAIDRYYRERNEHFKKHPKRAGKKIWGKERTPSVFSEANNCKDPLWCRID